MVQGISRRILCWFAHLRVQALSSLCLFAIIIIWSLPLYAASPLGSFVDSIFESSPAIQAAKYNVAAAKARERAASRPLYNPELTAEKQNALENTVSIGINQTVDWADKRTARGQVGAANARVAKAQLSELRQQLAAEILDALAQYQAKKQAVKLSKERTSLLKQFVNLTKKRYQSGDVARVDLDLAQLALSEALAQEADTEVSANKALQTLRAITGFNYANWPKLPKSLPLLRLKNVDANRLVTQLPSVSIFNQQYQGASARLKLAAREQYPDPTIGVQGGESSGDGERKKLVGLTLTLPIYIRNTYHAEVDAASYDAIEADKNRMNIMRQAKAGINSSAERYQTLYLATKSWQQSAGVPLSDGMTLIERLWQAGEITSTDYIVQLKQRIDSQIAGVELNGRAWQAWVEWLKSSGQIESWLQLSSRYQGESSR